MFRDENERRKYKAIEWGVVDLIVGLMQDILGFSRVMFWDEVNNGWNQMRPLETVNSRKRSVGRDLQERSEARMWRRERTRKKEEEEEGDRKIRRETGKHG